MACSRSLHNVTADAGRPYLISRTVPGGTCCEGLFNGEICQSFHLIAFQIKRKRGRSTSQGTAPAQCAVVTVSVGVLPTKLWGLSAWSETPRLGSDKLLG